LGETESAITRLSGSGGEDVRIDSSTAAREFGRTEREIGEDAIGVIKEPVDTHCGVTDTTDQLSTISSFVVPIFGSGGSCRLDGAAGKLDLASFGSSGATAAVFGVRTISEIALGFDGVASLAWDVAAVVVGLVDAIEVVAIKFVDSCGGHVSRQERGDAVDFTGRGVGGEAGQTGFLPVTLASARVAAVDLAKVGPDGTGEVLAIGGHLDAEGTKVVFVLRALVLEGSGEVDTRDQERVVGIDDTFEDTEEVVSEDAVTLDTSDELAVGGGEGPVSVPGGQRGLRAADARGFDVRVGEDSLIAAEERRGVAAILLDKTDVGGIGGQHERGVSLAVVDDAEESTTVSEGLSGVLVGVEGGSTSQSTSKNLAAVVVAVGVGGLEGEAVAGVAHVDDGLFARVRESLPSANDGSALD